MKGRRSYQMEARAEAAKKTGDDILLAVAALWREHTVDEISLETVAERAGVSKRTVLRRFGSKEGLIAAAIKADSAGIVNQRNQVPSGNVQAALSILLDHYEQDGKAVLRTLDLEEKFPAAKMIIEAGRQEHRLWCARVFAPYLPLPEQNDFERRLDAFVAATDLYLWKLLRHDLQRSAEETKQTLELILNGLLKPLNEKVRLPK